MWRSLFMDMYGELVKNCSGLSESVALGIHIFNISKGLQCTGLQEDDKETHDIVPEN